MPHTVLIKDDWSRGPESTGDELLIPAAIPVYHPHTWPQFGVYLRDCRMAFMKHVLPKFRRPVAPRATFSCKKNDWEVDEYFPINICGRRRTKEELCIFRKSNSIQAELTPSFNNFPSEAEFSWNFLFLCRSPISKELQQHQTSKR